jgi:DNA primase
VSVFETLRVEVPLEEVAGAKTGEKARCVAPGHEDTSPSMHNFGDHVHCFSCSFHGDVVDLWAVKRGFGKALEAALDLAREYDIALPDVSPEVRRRALKRREKEDRYLRQAQACHRALEKHPHVREWWGGRGFGEELQQRFLLGVNRDGTAALIPFWHRGRVQGFVRRKLEGAPKYLYPKREEFTGGHRPLYIPGVTRPSVFLVEGILDALAVAALGESVAAIGGTNISREQVEELRSIPGPLYVLADDDKEGAEAARRWVQDFYPRAYLCPADYGEDLKDVADLFRARGEAARGVLERLRARAVDALDLALPEVADGSARARYRYAKETVLPLLCQLEDEGERDAAIQDTANGLDLKVGQLRSALASLERQEMGPEEEPDLRVEGERRERALKLLEEPDFLDRAVDDTARLGHVGEQVTKKLALICAVSARSGNPIQPSTHAQSSAGKNALWDTVLSLLPEEMVVRRSGLSAKALFRTEANLKGAVLYLQEVAGSEDASYTIRVMQSDGRLEYESTEKMPDGGMKNVVYKTEGPTVIVQTTTRNHLHPENETRVFPIYIDESEEQTGRIVQSILKEVSGSGIRQAEREAIRQRWRDAIRLLEPAEVIIPYAGRVEIPSSPIRIRRDVRRLVDVVRVVAWLHQYQRERDGEGRILASEEDFATALSLVSESLTRAWKTLTPSEEKVLSAIKKLPEHLRRSGFRRRDLKVPGVSDRQVKEVLKSLTENGYLDCDGRAGPQGYSYTVAREAEEIALGISLRPLPAS